MTTRGALANDRKSGREAIGRSRGGLTTKIHLAADLRCRPVARLTSPGQHGDSPRFIPLMDAIRIQRRGKGRPRRRPGRAMADKAYSSAGNRAWLRQHHVQAVIPVKEDQKKHRRNRGRAGGRQHRTVEQDHRRPRRVERRQRGKPLRGARLHLAAAKQRGDGREGLSRTKDEWLHAGMLARRAPADAERIRRRGLPTLLNARAVRYSVPLGGGCSFLSSCCAGPNSGKAASDFCSSCTASSLLPASLAASAREYSIVAWKGTFLA